MKVISFIGPKNSGKTTAIERIISGLVKRNYTVGSIKEIHHRSFTMETGGTDTDRHKKAGASLVTARGLYEVNVMYPCKIPIEKILTLYDQDYIILEGVFDIDSAVIITANELYEIDERIDYRTIAVTGVIANKINMYKNIPVINCMTETEKLIDMVEENVPCYGSEEKVTYLESKRLDRTIRNI